MRIVVSLLLFCWCAFQLAAAQFEARLEPETVMEGEPFALELINRGNRAPELVNKPEGFTYVGSGQSTQIINGSWTRSVTYRFIAPKAGDYTIPPLKVRIGKENVSTPQLQLKVVKDHEAEASSGSISAEAVIGTDRKKFYVNEDIPLEVNVLYPRNVRLQLAYPQLDISKAVFRDFRRENPENPAFAPVQRGRQVVDGKLYEKYVFPTVFRVLVPENVTVRGTVDCNILLPENRRSRDPFDSFFSGSSYRRVGRKLQFSIPDITIEPLPPRPEKGFFLGLVGEYSGRAEFSAEEVNALEPVSLNIYLQCGKNGSFENLRPPEITLPDCRVYPGEVRQHPLGCMISYAVIPLKAGILKADVDFFYFDTAADAYRRISVEQDLTVKPPVGKVASRLEQSTPSAAETSTADYAEEKSVSEDDQPIPRTTLLYCKKQPATAGNRFFNANEKTFAWILFIAGPVFFLAAGAIRKIRSLRHADPDDLRRSRAVARRAELAAKVQNVPEEKLAQLATGEIAGYLCDRWKLPPGSAAQDIANAAHDPVLADVLQECANVSYLPAELAKNALSDSDRVRKVLLSSLRTLLLVSALLLLQPLYGAEKSVVMPANWHEALKAYDQGNYAAAEKYFSKYQQENPADPNVLYNLGCIAEASGAPEVALWNMESAGLISPLDSATHENRNVLRRKFFLPEIGRSDSPAEMVVGLRDRLHPDDYLLIAAATWCLLFIMLAFRKYLSMHWQWSIGGSLGAITALSLIFMICQYSSTYRDGQAVIISKNADLYTFPGKHNGKKSGVLPGGTPVDIIEEQSEYSLVSSKNIEGWVSNKDLRKLLMKK